MSGMKNTMLVAVVLVSMAAVSLGAAEKGVAVFGDSFDTGMTFAEWWDAQGVANGADGTANLEAGARIAWRGACPLEAICEVTVKVPEKGWAGVVVDGASCAVEAKGKAFALYRGLDGKSANVGKALADAKPGADVKLRVERTVAKGFAQYAFLANGGEIAKWTAKTPAQVKLASGAEAYPTFYLKAAGAKASFDDFSISAVKNANASPNVIVNSGFECDRDGVPPYFCFRGSFNWKGHTAEDYEKTFLRRTVVDTEVKHSGKQSLRVLVNDVSRGFNMYPWRSLTQQGASGVFSLWMKSSASDLPVELKIGGAKPRVVRLTTDWARYEICSTNMPKPGLFSPVNMGFGQAIKEKFDAKVWIDDLQLEFVPPPPGGVFAADRAYASAYRASDLDKGRLGPKERPRRPATIAVPKLPAGVKPSIALETWEKYAADAGEFLVQLEKPATVTKAFYACDDDNLYVGFRNFGEDSSLRSRPHGFKDASSICVRNSIEMLFSPTPDGRHYHYQYAVNEDRFDAFDEDKRWDGTWTSENRDVDGAVEYLLTLPFADFVENGITGQWTVNLIRNDRNAVRNQCPSTELSHSGASRDKPTWGVLELPADVAAKWTRLSAERAKAKAVSSAKVIGRLDFYMDEPEAKFRVWDEKGTLEEVALDITKMASGTNAVTVKAHGREWPATVVKLPYWKGATQVNQWTRSLVHRGKNVLMDSVCIIAAYNEEVDGRFPTIDLLAKNGFKYLNVCLWTNERDTIRAGRMLDQAAELGMSCILWTGDAEGKDWTRKQVRDALRRDNVVAQFVIDEPELGKPSDVVRDFMIAEKKHHPYTPVMMNNSVFGIPSKYADLKTDVFMLDCYVTSDEAGTVWNCLKQVDIMRAASDTKPCWYFLDGLLDMHYREPTYAEQVAQSWGTICAGGSGVTYFIELPHAEGNWRGLVQANREMQSLADQILSEEVCGAATTSEEAVKLRIRTSKCGGDWYFFSVNVDDFAMPKVTVTLPPDAPQDGTVEVLFENRTLQAKGGVFTDAYRPYERHVYRIK